MLVILCLLFSSSSAQEEKDRRGARDRMLTLHFSHKYAVDVTVNPFTVIPHRKCVKSIASDYTVNHTGMIQVTF